MKKQIKIRRHKTLPLLVIERAEIIPLPEIAVGMTFQELADFLLNYEEGARQTLFKEVSRYVGQL